MVLRVHFQREWQYVTVGMRCLVPCGDHTTSPKALISRESFDTDGRLRTQMSREGILNMSMELCHQRHAHMQMWAYALHETYKHCFFVVSLRVQMRWLPSLGLPCQIFKGACQPDEFQRKAPSHKYPLKGFSMWVLLYACTYADIHNVWNFQTRFPRFPIYYCECHL